MVRPALVHHTTQLQQQSITYFISFANPTLPEPLHIGIKNNLKTQCFNIFHTLNSNHASKLKLDSFRSISTSIRNSTPQEIVKSCESHEPESHSGKPNEQTLVWGKASGCRRKFNLMVLLRAENGHHRTTPGSRRTRATPTPIPDHYHRL